MTQKIIREKGRSIKIMTIELDVDDMEMMLESVPEPGRPLVLMPE